MNLDWLKEWETSHSIYETFRWRWAGEAIKFSGMDCGPHGLQVLARNGDLALLKNPSYKTWAGNGGIPWSSTATEYFLVTLTEPKLTVRGSWEFGRKHSRPVRFLMDLVANGEVPE